MDSKDVVGAYITCAAIFAGAFGLPVAFPGDQQVSGQVQAQGIQRMDSHGWSKELWELTGSIPPSALISDDFSDNTKVAAERRQIEEEITLASWPMH